MDQALKKIIFLDIGGVLLSNGWGHESRQAAAVKFGLDYEEMNTLHEFIFNIYEIGSINLDEYLNTTVFYTQRNFTREAFKEFMFSQSTELPHLLPWLVDWKQRQAGKIRVIAINNEGRELNQYRIAKFGLHRCFDAFVTSCEVGMRKPDPGIFSLAMGIAQAGPEQCVYFDDRPILVDAALRLGLEAYRHTDFETTKQILERLIT
jgi:putative hydrolase of the HAD superfamily